MGNDTEVLSFTSTPAEPGLRLTLRQAFRSGQAIVLQANGRLRSVRIADYLEWSTDDGVSVTATLVPVTAVITPSPNRQPPAIRAA